jgi:hypothetical protein
MKNKPLIIMSIILIAMLVVGYGWFNQKNNNEASETAGQNLENRSDENTSDETNDSNNNDQSSDDPDTPVSSDIDIIVETPIENQLVSSGQDLVIKGQTKLQKFKIGIEDGHNILGETVVELKENPEGLTEFETVIELDEHTSPFGMIIFFSTDENGNRHEELLIPIKFE